MPFVPLRPLSSVPKPMIFPPVLVDVLSHASSENVCGPDCQNGEIMGTVPVMPVPAKAVAVSASPIRAPGTPRPPAVEVFRIASFEPAWSYAVAPLASPIRHCQTGTVGEHRCGIRRRRRGSVGDRHCRRRADERGAERVGRADAVGLAAARRRGRVEEAERRTVPPRRAVGVGRVDDGRGRRGRAAQHLELQVRVVAIPRRGPADAHRARTHRCRGGSELAEALDRVDTRRHRTLCEPDEALLVHAVDARELAAQHGVGAVRVDAPRRLTLPGVRTAGEGRQPVQRLRRRPPLERLPDTGCPERVRERGRPALVDRHRALERQRVGLRVPVEHPPVVRMPDRVEDIAGHRDVVVVAATAVDPVELAGRRVRGEGAFEVPLPAAREEGPADAVDLVAVGGERVDRGAAVVVLDDRVHRPRPDRAAHAVERSHPRLIGAVQRVERAAHDHAAGRGMEHHRVDGQVGGRSPRQEGTRRRVDGRETRARARHRHA